MSKISVINLRETNNIINLFGWYVKAFIVKKMPAFLSRKKTLKSLLCFQASGWKRSLSGFCDQRRTRFVFGSFLWHASASAFWLHYFSTVVSSAQNGGTTASTTVTINYYYSMDRPSRRLLGSRGGKFGPHFGPLTISTQLRGLQSYLLVRDCFLRKVSKHLTTSKVCTSICHRILLVCTLLPYIYVHTLAGFDLMTYSFNLRRRAVETITTM
jgi:hypothetical protein